MTENLFEKEKKEQPFFDNIQKFRHSAFYKKAEKVLKQFQNLEIYKDIVEGKIYESSKITTLEELLDQKLFAFKLFFA